MLVSLQEVRGRASHAIREADAAHMPSARRAARHIAFTLTTQHADA